jgi:hypothetical protein
LVLALSVVGTASLPGQTINVTNDQELKSALADIKGGCVVNIAPGEYSGGWSLRNVARLTIQGSDAANPPLFKGGSIAWHFSRCDGLTLRHLRVRGQTANGINLDNGDAQQSLTSGITLQGIQVMDIGPKGNRDGIKCSGLRAFTIRECVVEGWAGQGIDFVGCHQGLVTECRFAGKEGFSATAGVQIKGGSADIVVEKCRFVRAGQRPLNVGGSTGRAYFRPPDARHEATRIVVRKNVFEGGPCAAAFVGADGAEFTKNTILYPEKWIFRILQENREEMMVPCQNVVIRDNAIVFRRSQVQVDVNESPGVNAASFRFEGNRWYAEDRPTASKPRLPSQEVGGEWGTDPRPAADGK